MEVEDALKLVLYWFFEILMRGLGLFFFVFFLILGVLEAKATWLVVKMLVPEFGPITPFTLGPALYVSCGPTIPSFQQNPR